MYAAFIHSLPAFGGQIRVRTLSDLEYLVKESEVLTGQPGRTFLICGAERIAYRVGWHQNGYSVQRLTDSGELCPPVYLLPRLFNRHVLAEAMRAGCLFTPTLLN